MKNTILTGLLRHTKANISLSLSLYIYIYIYIYIDKRVFGISRSVLFSVIIR